VEASSGRLDRAGRYSQGFARARRSGAVKIDGLGFEGRSIRRKISHLDIPSTKPRASLLTVSSDPHACQSQQKAK
jgi:hypothetical protein